MIPAPKDTVRAKVKTMKCSNILSAANGSVAKNKDCKSLNALELRVLNLRADMMQPFSTVIWRVEEDFVASNCLPPSNTVHRTVQPPLLGRPLDVFRCCKQLRNIGFLKQLCDWERQLSLPSPSVAVLGTTWGGRVLDGGSGSTERSSFSTETFHGTGSFSRKFLFMDRLIYCS